MANEKQNPDTQGLEIDALQARTTASEGHPERGRCRRCGEPVRGRRRNGYCADKCRMKDHRDAERRRRLALLDTISAVVEELRREVRS